MSVTVLNAVSIPHSFEFIALKVHLSSNNAFNVVGVYRPPSAVTGAIDNLANLLAPYSNLVMLVLGDFNINWLTNDSNTLKEVCDNLNLSQLIEEPTRPNMRDPPK